MIIAQLGPGIALMCLLLRTNDTVLLSFAEAVLAGKGIEALIFDRHISLVEGSIGAFPRRLMVADAEADRARQVLCDAGLGEWIERPGP